MANQSRRFLVFLALLLVAGCGREATNFNRNILRTIRNLDETGRPLGTALRQEKDPARLQAVYTETASKVKTLVAEANKIQVPDLPEAQSYWSAFQNYLKDQEKMLTEDFKELVTLRSNPLPDKSRIEEIQKSAQATETADMTKLQEAREAFAKANNLPIR